MALAVIVVWLELVMQFAKITSAMPKLVLVVAGRVEVAPVEVAEEGLVVEVAEDQVRHRSPMCST